MSHVLAARSSGPVAAEAPAPRIRGVGLLTGWGDGVAALAGATGAGGLLVGAPTPALAGERFRRAPRECLLGVAAVKAAAADAGLDATALAGGRTGMLYVSATAYAAANRAFLEDEGSTTLHFPYTAPSAVPAEATIEFGIHGPYVNLMGGGTAALQGLWQAARWLVDGVADRVLVLGVEAVHEVGDLFTRARRLYRGPLVESAACLLLEPGDGASLAWASTVARGEGGDAAVAAVLAAVTRARPPRAVVGCAGPRGPGRAEARALGRGADAALRLGPAGLGETLGCGPLIGLAQARAAGLRGLCLVTASWREDYGAMAWPF